MALEIIKKIIKLLNSNSIPIYRIVTTTALCLRASKIFFVVNYTFEDLDLKLDG